MSNSRLTFRLTAAFAALIILALAAGCRGFFVNPTLTAITVTPVTPAILLGQSQQMTATGTFSDGSTSTHISNLSWSIDPTTYATISPSGLVTGNVISQATSTITASSGTISGTTTATVVLANVSNITVSPSSATATSSTPADFKASATISGKTGTVDITASATWTSTAASGVLSMSFDGVHEVFSVTGTLPTNPYVVTVTASYPGTTAVGTATLTCTQ